MSDLPDLTESDVRRWTDGAYFERGQGYFRSGHIFDPRLQGNTLKARCLGSGPTPYRVEMTLGQKGIVFGEMKGCLPESEAGYTLEQVILGALEGLDVPIALGLSSGHTSGPNVTLPLGTRARLESGETARFSVLEPGVS